MATWKSRIRLAGRGCLAILFLLVCTRLGVSVVGFAQEPKKEGRTETQSSRPAFAEADAVRVLDDLRQGLESHSRSRFLKSFDARRMPGYAAFRDQVDEFFETYDSTRMNYRLTQVTMDGEFAAVLAEITLETTRRDATPSTRRDAQTRLVLAWDGKAWKIADLAPRNLFRSAS